MNQGGDAVEREIRSGGGEADREVKIVRGDLEVGTDHENVDHLKDLAAKRGTISGFFTDLFYYLLLLSLFFFFIILSV